MIFREVDGRLIAVRQTDHALLSGAFAARWGSRLDQERAIPDLPRRAPTVVAAARHDDGWGDWELAPSLGPDGDPVDFIRVPRDEHVALYRHGIDLVCTEDPFAGLVVSMHGERLYTRPFVPGMDPMITRLTGRDRDLSEAYVEGERERQSRLLASLDPDARKDAEEAWRLVQVWDRLSLFVCMQAIPEIEERTLPPVRGVDGEDVQISLRGAGEDVIELDPYPFREAPAAFDLETIELPRTRWDDAESYRRDVRLAPRRTMTFTARGVAS